MYLGPVAANRGSKKQDVDVTETSSDGANTTEGNGAFDVTKFDSDLTKCRVAAVKRLPVLHHSALCILLSLQRMGVLCAQLLLQVLIFAGILTWSEDVHVVWV